jgi:ribosomal-protein-alanine acetyltransferase
MSTNQAINNTVREAGLPDLEALLDIENRCFTADKLSRRNFRYMLTKAKAITLIQEINSKPAGYALVLFHAGTALARLYSVATLPEFRGLGLGKQLLETAERTAREHGCIAIRLEVRHDNHSAINLYRKFGYRELNRLEDYYEDHVDGVRMEKSLVPHLNPELVRVPYYQQTLEFTCGPAALMMAMKSLDPAMLLDRKLELRLWREATTIFMTAGHGGCGPFGLALSAYQRGFDVEVIVKDEAALFVDSVRSPEKKEVVTLVHEDFLEQIAACDIKVHHTAVSVADLEAVFQAGGVPVVLISSYRLYQEKVPHWVVVTGFDARFIYLHDPFVDYEFGRTSTDCMNLPILKEEFEGMARYGKSGQRAVVILRRPLPQLQH